MYEKYTGAKVYNSPPNKKVINNIKLDNYNKYILSRLSLEARVDSSTLARELQLSTPAVINRIRNLENTNYIQKYNLFLNLPKLGIYLYSVFIKINDLTKKQNIKDFLIKHPKISFIAEYIGEEFLEFGLFVDDPYKFREELQKIEDKLSINRVIEISMFQKEIISIGAPPCIFK